VRRADKLTTFRCRLSWNLGASNCWNPQGLSRHVMGLLNHFKIATKNLDNQITYINRGLGSSVGMATRLGAGQTKDRGSVLSRDKSFPFSKASYWLSYTPSFLFKTPRLVCPRIKPTGAWGYFSHLEQELRNREAMQPFVHTALLHLEHIGTVVTKQCASPHGTPIGYFLQQTRFFTFSRRFHNRTGS
jgi:hypothetical protein